MRGRHVRKSPRGKGGLAYFFRRYGRLLMVGWIALAIVVSGVYLVRQFKKLFQGGPVRPSAVVSSPTPQPTPDLRWKWGIREQPQEPINLTWIYRPRTYTGTPQGVTVLSPTWFNVEEKDGQAVLLSTPQMGEAKAEDLKAYVQSAHADGTQVWGTVVSHTPALSEQVVRNAERRQAFMQALLGFVQEYDLDGVCLDFENMNPEHKLDFSAFAQELHDLLPEDVILSAAVTPKLENASPTNWWQCYDYPTLAQACDFLAVMTYDQYGKGSQTGGPVAATWWVEGMMRVLLREIPSDQLLMGLPFYGRDFRYEADAQGNWQPVWPSDTNGTCPVYQKHLNDLLSAGEFTDVRGHSFGVKTWQEKAGYEELGGSRLIAFIDTEDVLHRIWYDDAQTLYEKAQLSRTYRLAGTAVWEASYAEQVQWKAVHEALTDPAPDLPQR